MFFWWNALERDVVFLEGVLKVLRALIVENVEIWSVTMFNEHFMRRLPGFANASSLAIGNGLSMDGVGVMMV